MKNFKTFSIFVAIIMSLLLIFYSYYSFPLSTTYVFKHLEKIERIYLNYLEDGEIARYSINIDDTRKRKELVRILEKNSYSRAFGKTNIRNDGRTLMMTIMYRESEKYLRDYNLDINEKGFIVRDKKKYEVENKSNRLFQDLFAWSIENGVEEK